MKKSIKGTITEQNLLKAFAGECQAKNRYELFAEKARKEGFEQIAAIFIKTASQEQSHAKQFIKFMEGGGHRNNFPIFNQPIGSDNRKS